jgi:hypothetical protein
MSAVLHMSIVDLWAELAYFVMVTPTLLKLAIEITKNIVVIQRRGSLPHSLRAAGVSSRVP